MSDEVYQTPNISCHIKTFENIENDYISHWEGDNKHTLTQSSILKICFHGNKTKNE